MIPSEEYRDFSRCLFDRGVFRKRPLKAQIELTYRCNIRCVHCYTDCFNNPRDVQNEMETGKILSLLDEIEEAGSLWVGFTGGEIFMRKDFFEIYDYARRKGFIITLLTNVTMVNEEIADRLAANPPFSIDTSCHGVGDTFDRITQVRGSFEKFDKGIRLLLKRGLPVKVKTKIMTLNRGEMEKIKEYIESLGLDFRFSTDMNVDLKGSAKPLDYMLRPKERVALGRKMEDNSEKERCLEIEDLLSEPSEKLYRCGCGTNSFLIGAHGKLASCVSNRRFEKDLYRQGFLKAFEELNWDISSLTYQGNSPCRSCQITAFCDKKPGWMFLEGKDPEEIDFLSCETAHLKVKNLIFKDKGEL